MCLWGGSGHCAKSYGIYYLLIRFQAQELEEPVVFILALCEAQQPIHRPGLRRGGGHPAQKEDICLSWILLFFPGPWCMGDTSVLDRVVLSLAGDSNASQIHTLFFPCHIMCIMHVLWGMTLQVFFLAHTGHSLPYVE